MLRADGLRPIEDESLLQEERDHCCPMKMKGLEMRVDVARAIHGATVALGSLVSSINSIATADGIPIESRHRLSKAVALDFEDMARALFRYYGANATGLNRDYPA